ncbi:hypothetical protein BDV95DRAFT_581945 [Massariosphaeria phaeospora]|uniref:VOC domain-containing protein n=1 Tax=Massariosphaeria phaeospora TaxID=100035 RepID=A0A7C8I0F2_9PLEO|nr:hypothetical protein BDV95DRAFT_581945 [Massariosphaeria phaeospora]
MRGRAGRVGMQECFVRRAFVYCSNRDQNQTSRSTTQDRNNMSSSAPASDSAPQPGPPPQGAPCWIEILADEPRKLKEFYAALFPAWQFKAAAEAYPEDQIAMFEFKQPAGLYGGIVKRDEKACPGGDQPLGTGFTAYFYVDSIDETEKKVGELGGVKLTEKRPEGKTGWFAKFKDPEGNRFALYEAMQ